MYKNKGDVSSIDETESDVKLYGVQCRYNTIQYNMILHKSLRWLWQNVDEGLNPLTGELWGVFCEDLGETWPSYNGTTLYMVTCY